MKFLLGMLFGMTLAYSIYAPSSDGWVYVLQDMNTYQIQEESPDSHIAISEIYSRQLACELVVNVVNMQQRRQQTHYRATCIHAKNAS